MLRDPVAFGVLTVVSLLLLEVNRFTSSLVLITFRSLSLPVFIEGKF